MTSLQHAIRQSWRLFAIIAALVVVFLLTVGVGIKEISDDHRAAGRAKRDLQCVADWANATAARTERLTVLNKARNDAQADVLVSALSRDRGKIRAALERFKQANDTYNRALITNPLPPAPQFVCSGIKPTAAAASVVVTVTPAPSTLAGPVRTTTRTAQPQPRAVSTPTVTVTMTAPGPTSTVTRTRTETRTVTRTATVTVTPPPCSPQPLCSILR